MGLSALGLRRDPCGSVKQIDHEELEDGDKERPSAFPKIMLNAAVADIMKESGFTHGGFYNLSLPQTLQPSEFCTPQWSLSRSQTVFVHQPFSWVDEKEMSAAV
jgi:hypothetical protein